MVGLSGQRGGRHGEIMKRCGSKLIQVAIRKGAFFTHLLSPLPQEGYLILLQSSPKSKTRSWLPNLDFLSKVVRKIIQQLLKMDPWQPKIEAKRFLNTI